MHDQYVVAVIGATGNVGREVLKALAEREFPCKKVHVVASRESMGVRISFGEDDELTVEALDLFDFSTIDLAFFCAGSEISKRYVPIAVSAGAMVIDKSSHFRQDPRVALVVPEVNTEALPLTDTSKIVANPNCVAIPAVMALHPLHSVAKITHVSLATYQSVSGAGKAGMDELFDQTKKRYFYQDPSPSAFKHPIAFNIIPEIGDLQPSGYSSEEEKIIAEIQKIMLSSAQQAEFTVSATAVRVPVFIGHSIAMEVEFEEAPSMPAIMQALQSFPGITLLKDDAEHPYATPSDVVGEDAVFISRVRVVPGQPNRIALWLVTDNLRKGAALNALQIAELLAEEGYL
jgi:aspartate-semialdehyde dehydrogenase